MFALDPEWIITGARLPDGQVQLIASRDVLDAELKHFERYRKWLDGAKPASEIEQGIELTIGMAGYVMVIADDYPAAFERLFRQWQPPGEPVRQPLSGPLALADVPTHQP